MIYHFVTPLRFLPPAPASASVFFSDLIKQGVVEYVDVNEENNCLVSLSDADLTLNHTHLEIDPLTLLGVVAGLIPVSYTHLTLPTIYSV